MKSFYLTALVFENFFFPSKHQLDGGCFSLSISRIRETLGHRWKTPEIGVGLWLLEEVERRVPKLHRSFWMAISLCQLTFTQSRIKPEDRLFIFKEITQDTHSP